jgi:hypothetical protein
VGNGVSSIIFQATRMDKLARDKEAKFANDEEKLKRKAVLSDKMTNCAAEEKKVSLDCVLHW